jgi:hypothetical protein
MFPVVVEARRSPFVVCNVRGVGGGSPRFRYELASPLGGVRFVSGGHLCDDCYSQLEQVR